MGSGGKHSSHWCDVCKSQVPYSDWEKAESTCMFCESGANKARAEAAEAALASARAEVNYLQRELGRVETYWRERLGGAR